MTDAERSPIVSRTVVMFSGHMIDLPNRAGPRFPPERECDVGDAIAAALQAWEVGPGDLCLSSGARGGDILFSERCLDTGAEVRWLLPLPVDRFVARSVSGAGADWETRFRTLLDRVTVQVADPLTDGDAAGSPFVKGNLWLLATARVEAAPGWPHVLLVWDGRAGDGVGGTSEVAARAREQGWTIRVIDPARP